MPDKYNGWTNYATWRVNLEICDDLCASMNGEQTFETISELADYLENAVDDILTGYGENEDSIAVSYARAFVGNVDWIEIAESHSRDRQLLEPSDDDESE